MADRFERLYELPNNLYSAGSPIIIAAGALLKDTQTGSVIVQLKYQSVASEIIKALRISIIAYDVSGNKIQGKDNYQYLDLSVQNGQTFGSNKAIVLPDITTRSFAIESLRVVFENGTSTDIPLPLAALPKAVSLQEQIDNEELIKQYQLATNEKAICIPHKSLDLWLCSCGHWNRQNKCPHCGLSQEHSFSAYNTDLLTENMEMRLDMERIDRQRQAEQKAKDDAERKKKIKLFSIVGIALICVIVISSFIISSVKQKNAIIEIDKLIASEQYEHAFDAINRSNLSDEDKDGYRDFVIPYMQRQAEYKKNDEHRLNIDGLYIFEEDNDIYYHSNGKKVTLYSAVEKGSIGTDFMYANGKILFLESVRYTKYNGKIGHDYYVRYVDLETGEVTTIDEYFDFYNFVKLRDGRIAIQIMMGSDGADYVFDPYTEAVSDGDNQIKAKDIDNSLYHSHMLYLGEVENKMPLPTKESGGSNASLSVNDQTLDNLNFADNYLGKTVNSSNHADLTDQEEDFLNKDVVLFGITGRYHLGASSSQTEDRIVDDLRWESKDVVTDYEAFLNCLMEIYGDTYDEDYIIISIEDSDETYTWIATEKYNYVTCWQNSDGTVTLHWMI